MRAWLQAGNALSKTNAASISLRSAGRIVSSPVPSAVAALEMAYKHPTHRPAALAPDFGTVYSVPVNTPLRMLHKIAAIKRLIRCDRSLDTSHGSQHTVVVRHQNQEPIWAGTRSRNKCRAPSNHIRRDLARAQRQRDRPGAANAARTHPDDHNPAAPAAEYGIVDRRAIGTYPRRPYPRGRLHRPGIQSILLPGQRARLIRISPDARHAGQPCRTARNPPHHQLVIDLRHDRPGDCIPRPVTIADPRTSGTRESPVRRCHHSRAILAPGRNLRRHQEQRTAARR